MEVDLSRRSVLAGRVLVCPPIGGQGLTPASPTSGPWLRDGMAPAATRFGRRAISGWLAGALDGPIA